MRTKLLIFAAAIALSFAFIGCKGGNTPDDPSESNPKYTYNASTHKYEVTLNNGQKLYFKIAILEVKEGIVTKLDTALTLISYPNYKRADDKSYKEEEPYLYRGNVSIPPTIILDKKWTIHAMMKQVFYYCTELNSVELPQTIDKITYNAFGGCKQLKEISFYSTEIEEAAFYDCVALESIKSYSVTPPQIVSSRAFYNVPKFNLYVPQNSIEAYKQSAWKNYAKEFRPIE